MGFFMPMPNQNDINHIEAAGKILSGQSLQSIKGAIKHLWDLVLASGIPESEVLESLGVAQAPYKSIQESQVEAGALLNAVDSASWDYRLQTALDYFRWEFAWLAKESQESDEYREKIADLRSDLETVLDQLATAPQSQVIAVSATADDTQFTEVSLWAPSNLPVNRRSFKGVLARLDEPSNFAPQGTNGLPILIPREVAIAAAKNSAGLPLNAAPDLSGHFKEGVIGIFVSANVEGSELVVEGSLFDHNLPDTIASIAGAKDNLGMSLEAYIRGNPEDVNGSQVFVVSELILTGATVALRDRVAYSETSVIAAESETQDNDQLAIPIAATAEIQSKETDIMENEILNTFNSKFDQLTDQLTQLTQVIGAQQSNIEALQSNFESIQAERQQEEERRQIEAAKAAELQRQNELQSMIEATVSRALGSRGSGRRTVTPLQIAATDSNTQNDPKTAIQNEMLIIQGQIQALAESPTYDGQKELTLKQRLQDLNAQLAQ